MKRFVFTVFLVLSILMLASCATKVQAEPEAEKAAEAKAADYIFDVQVSQEDPSYLVVFLQQLPGYAWNPRYASESDLAVLSFQSDNIQSGTATTAAGEIDVIVFVFQALAPVNELTFACDLKEETTSNLVSRVSVSISIDDSRRISVLRSVSGIPEEL